MSNKKTNNNRKSGNAGKEAMPPSEGTTSRGAGNQPLVMTSKVGAVMVTTIALLSETVSQRDTTLTE